MADQQRDRIGHGRSIWRAAATGKFDLPRSYPIDCGVQNEIGLLARSAIRFDISNVAEYFFAGSDQDYWEWAKDFPCIAPPFETMWMEYGPPSGIRAERTYQALQSIDVTETPSFGVLIHSVRSEDFEERQRLNSSEPNWSMSGAFVQYTRTLDNSGVDLPDGWILEARTFRRVPGVGVSLYPPILMVRLNAEGVAFDGPGVIVPFLRELGGRDLANKLSTVCSAAMLPVAFALSLMHCKNIRIGDKADDRTRVEKARDLRAGIPELKFKTLDIEPMRRVLSTEGNASQHGLKKALHICRGHFSEYSEERPLFGKYAGRFWIPSHVRGTTESGQVIKDYRVKAPRSA